MSNIAIIGIGCRFPGGVGNTEQYWNLLTESRSAISEIPADRWLLDGFYDPNPNNIDRSYSKWGGFLSDVTSFDPDFFNLSAREAEALDPQQRILMQITYEAIQDAGVQLSRLQNGCTGIFAGASNTDYGLLQRFRLRHGDILAGTGTALSIIANRLSNCFNFSGPSATIDTACSSSIVALNAACDSLNNHACDAAFAAGVNILLDPRMFMTFCRAQMLSPTGEIRAFDKAANGFVRGEGAGVLLLKREADARRHGDNIYALIEATAINQDGGTGTITAPSKSAQIDLMRDVLAKAGRNPEDISFVEAHGTGTPVGDPIEAQAIGIVIGSPKRLTPLPVGSVKPNIGHLEPAAGIAGIIKAALSIKHGKAPPNIGYEFPNPEIPLDALNLEVPTTIRETAEAGGESVVMVNSFGFGGTNACALLSGHQVSLPKPKIQRTTSSSKLALFPDRKTIPVPISAKSPEQLKAYAYDIFEFLKSDHAKEFSIIQIASTLASRRDHFDFRAVIVARSKEELSERLQCLSEGKSWPRNDKSDPEQIFIGKSKPDRKIAFTMTGQGGQWWAMGRQLLESSPIFQKTILEFDSVFSKDAGWSTIDVLKSNQSDSKIHESAITPPVMFALQSGLASIWSSLGINPEILVGHSFGEVTAAFLGGAIDKNSVAHLVTYRGSIRDHINRQGGMAAIGLGAADIKQHLPSDGSIEIGAFNSPSMVTITGDAAAIDDFISSLNDYDPQLLTHKLDLDFAWHSSWLDPVENLFKQSVGPLNWSAPRQHVISTVTGKLETRFDTDYWWENLRRPVKYEDAVYLALKLGADTFIELGPHRTLSSLTAGCANAQGKQILTVSTLHKNLDDFESVSCAIGELYVNGIDFDWLKLLGDEHRKVPVPNLPWMNQNLWTEPEESKSVLLSKEWHPLLGTQDTNSSHSWSNEFSLTSLPILSEHRIFGEAVFPASCYIEIIRAAIEQCFNFSSMELRNVEFFDALYLGAEDNIHLNTVIEKDRSLVRIYSRSRDNDCDWVERCSARFFKRNWAKSTHNSHPGVPAEKIDDFYQKAQELGYQYGPQFRGLKYVQLTDNICKGKAETKFGKPTLLKNIKLDPALLDSCFQLIIAQAIKNNTNGVHPKTDGSIFLPRLIERIDIKAPLLDSARAYLKTENRDNTLYGIKLQILNSDNYQGLEISGIKTAALPNDSRENDASNFIGSYYNESYLEISKFHPSVERPDQWLIVGNKDCQLLDKLSNSMTESDLHNKVIGVDENAAVTSHSYLTRLKSFIDERNSFSIVYLTPNNCPTANKSESFGITEGDISKVIQFGQAIEMLYPNANLNEVWFLSKDAHQKIAPSYTYYGLVRTFALEMPDVRFLLADLDDEILDNPENLTDIFLSGTEESELVFKGSQIFVPRLHELDRSSIGPINNYRQFKVTGTNNFELHQSVRGIKDSLDWQECAISVPGQGQVLVQIQYVGLNFRDVMAVNNLLPEDAEPDDPSQNLGLEFSGIVHKVGQEVAEFKRGDRVFGMARGVLKKYVTLDDSQLQLIPEHISQLEAATIPSAFLTAYYSLIEIAQLKKGMRVLIHSAAGGVGLAAVAISKFAGADIYATAGSELKRNYLKKIGIENIYDSRSLDFSDEILEQTNGEGVDVILNSLSGPYLEKSLECLAAYGRFVELGKRDIYEDRPIGLKYLRNNVSIHAIDLAALIVDQPLLRDRLMRNIVKLFRSRELFPLPIKEFGSSEIIEAFDWFSQKSHIGKIIVNIGDLNTRVLQNDNPQIKLDKDASYLVTGGTSGFGLEVAGWLAKNDAGQVILASKSGTLSKQNQEKFYSLKNNYPGIKLIKLDVTQKGEVTNAIAQIEKSEKPLKGIIHSAAVYQDSFLSELSRDKIISVLAPKIEGGKNLTHAILHSECSLQFFISFSSLASEIGWKGQSHYAAANSYLISLAHHQNQIGIPGKCIVWGALGDAGHVHRNRELNRYLTQSGWKCIGNEEALKVLNDSILSNSPVVIYSAADWNQLANTNPTFASSARLKDLIASESRQSENSAAILNWKNKEITRDVFKQLILDQLCKILRVQADAIKNFDLLEDTGLDSLSSFDLKIRLEGETGFIIPFRSYVETNSISKLSELMMNLWVKSQETVSTPAEIETKKDELEKKPTNDTLPIQRWFLDSLSRPMTSKLGQKSMYHWVSITFKQPVERKQLEVCWSNIVSEVLSTLSGGNKPYEIVEDKYADDEENLFTLLTEEQNQIINCCLKISKAITDKWSAALIAENFIEILDKKLRIKSKTEINRSNLDLLPMTKFDRAGENQSLSYWNTTLRDIPEMMFLPQRNKALAPFGLGQNSGPAKTLHLSVVPINSVSSRVDWETFILACYAHALALCSEAENLIVEVELSNRNHVAFGKKFGPVSSFIPILFRKSDSATLSETVKLMDRQLKLGRFHSGLDIFRLEELFAKDWRDNNTVPNQFGFNYLPLFRNPPKSLPFKDSIYKDSIAKKIDFRSPSIRHDLHLEIFESNNEIDIVLSYDMDAIKDGWASELLAALRKFLASHIQSEKDETGITVY